MNTQNALISFVIFNLLFFATAFGQVVDSSSTSRTYRSLDNLTDQRLTSGAFSASKREKRYIVKDHVTVGTFNFQLSPVETEFSDLESQECQALLKRDTASLKKIWARDFTLDEPTNKIQVGILIPYYTTLSRIIEDITVLGNVVYTKRARILLHFKRQWRTR